MTEAQHTRVSPILEPRSLTEKLQNRFLALRFGEILSKAEKVLDNDAESLAGLRRKKSDRPEQITLVTISNINKITEYNKDADVPSEFGLPVYLVQAYISPSNESPLITSPRITETPYGELPEYVVGADDKVYVFGVNYILSEDGHAIKRQHVMESARKFSENEKNSLKKLEFIPNRRHSSYARLQREDHKRLIGLLSELETNKFSRA